MKELTDTIKKKIEDAKKITDNDASYSDGDDNDNDNDDFNVDRYDNDNGTYPTGRAPFIPSIFAIPFTTDMNPLKACLLCSVAVPLSLSAAASSADTTAAPGPPPPIDVVGVVVVYCSVSVT